MSTTLPESTPWIGRTLAGEFEIESKLGAGNQGTVYRAVQRPVDRPVAVKILDGRACDSPTLRARFMREARVLGQLTDAGVVRLVRFGSVEPGPDDPGCLYLVQEIAPGRSLRDIIDSEGALEPARAIRIATQVLGALADAHRHGIVHRDLKPPHILVHADARGVERVKVIDFGLAHIPIAEDDEVLTMKGWALGSPRYMAPETIQGEAVTDAADQYALGNILFEMLTGLPPFMGKTMHVLRSHIHSPAPELDPALDPTGDLARIIARAMAKAPEARYLDAGEMAAELEYALGELEDDDRTLVESRSAALDAELVGLQVETEIMAQPIFDHLPASNPDPRPGPRSIKRWVAGVTAGIAIVCASVGAAAMSLL